MNRSVNRRMKKISFLEFSRSAPRGTLISESEVDYSAYARISLTALASGNHPQAVSLASSEWETFPEFDNMRFVDSPDCVFSDVRAFRAGIRTPRGDRPRFVDFFVDLAWAPKLNSVVVLVRNSVDRRRNLAFVPTVANVVRICLEIGKAKSIPTKILQAAFRTHFYRFGAGPHEQRGLREGVETYSQAVSDMSRLAGSASPVELVDSYRRHLAAIGQERPETVAAMWKAAKAEGGFGKPLIQKVKDVFGRRRLMQLTDRAFIVAEDADRPEDVVMLAPADLIGILEFYCGTKYDIASSRKPDAASAKVLKAALAHQAEKSFLLDVSGEDPEREIDWSNTWE